MKPTRAGITVEDRAAAGFRLSYLLQERLPLSP